MKLNKQNKSDPGDNEFLHSIRIREFGIQDYETLIRFWQKAELSHRPGGRDSKDNIRRELKQGNAVFLIAEKDKNIVGSVLGTYDGRKGWVNRLAVDPAYRRKGMAKLLIEEAEKRLASLGAEIIACLIEDWNDSSIRLFQKMQYVKHPDILYLSKRKNEDT
jgi:ribosomal protein S18 acetylase RimI-like enzyme